MSKILTKTIARRVYYVKFLELYHVTDQLCDTIGNSYSTRSIGVGTLKNNVHLRILHGLKLKTNLIVSK